MNQIQKKQQQAYIDTCQFIYRHPLTGFLHRQGHRAIQNMVSHPQGKIIDLGCGKGDHFPYMQDCDFVGLDNNKTFLAQAKKHHPHSKLIFGSIYQIPFKPESFDSAITFGVLEHLSNLKRALSEIQRILRSDGELLVLIPIENFIYRVGRNLTIKRYIEKKYQISYAQLLKQEHINSYSNILSQLDRHFHIEKKVNLPFRIPLSSLNLFTIIKCKKISNNI